MFKYTLLNSAAKPLSRANPMDSGYDLFPTESISVNPGQTVKVPTGIAMVSYKQGWASFIMERSGLALKNSIRVGGGVIDATYTGEICVIVQNLGNEVFEVSPNKAIAQLVFQPVAQGIDELILVDKSEIPKTERGANGFGSTDKKINE